MALNLSGLQNIASQVGQIGQVAGQVAAQQFQAKEAEAERQRGLYLQAEQYKFQATAQKVGMDIEGFAQLKFAEYSQNWNDQDFDKENVVENFNEELQNFYEENGKNQFTQTQAAQFEQNVTSLKQAYQSKLNEKIIGFNIASGQNLFVNNYNQAIANVSSGGIVSGAKEDVDTSVDGLFATGFYATEAEAETARESAYDSINKNSIMYEMQSLINATSMSAKDAREMVNYIVTGEGESDYKEQAQSIRDSLVAQDGLDLVDMTTASNLVSSAIALTNQKKSLKNNEQIDNVNQISSSLNMANAERPVSYLQVKEAYGDIESDDIYAKNSFSQWASTGKDNDDARSTVDTNLSYKEIVSREDFRMEDLESIDFGIFHDQVYAGNYKAGLVANAESVHDSNIEDDIIDSYLSLTIEELEQREDVIDDKTQGMLDNMVDRDRAKEFEQATRDGILAEFKIAKATAYTTSSESKYLEIETGLMRKNQSVEKDQSEISNAFTRGEITSDQRDDLLTVAGKWKNSQAYNSAIENFKAISEVYADIDTNGELSPEEQAVANHHEMLLRAAFKNQLDRNPEQDTDDYINEVYNSMSSLDEMTLEFINTKYDENVARYWLPGNEGDRKDFDNFTYLLYNDSKYNSSEYMPEAYQLHRKGALTAIQNEFGDQSYNYFPDDFGAMYQVTDVSNIPKLANFVKEQTGDSNTEITVSLQYLPIPGSETETGLYVGYQKDVAGQSVKEWALYKENETELSKAEELAKPTEIESEIGASTFTASITLPTTKDIDSSTLTKSQAFDVKQAVGELRVMDEVSYNAAIAQLEEGDPFIAEFINNFVSEQADPTELIVEQPPLPQRGVKLTTREEKLKEAIFNAIRRTGKKPNLADPSFIGLKITQAELDKLYNLL